LIIANNVRVSRDNIIENRRGYASYGAVDDPPVQKMKYRERVLVHDGSEVHYDNGSGTFAAYSGTYSAISGTKLHYQESKNNVYVTTSEGIKVFQDVADETQRDAFLNMDWKLVKEEEVVEEKTEKKAK
jgi:hypothetical protein